MEKEDRDILVAVNQELKELQPARFVELLLFIREGKWHLDGDKKWYSSNNRGDYSQPAQRYTDEELVKKFLEK